MLLDHPAAAPPTRALATSSPATRLSRPARLPDRFPDRFPTVMAAQSRPPTLALRVWVAGELPGVNHSQRGMGKGRHLTAKAQTWAQLVEQAVLAEVATRRMRRDLWQPPATTTPTPPAVTTPRSPSAAAPVTTQGHLGVRLHFFVAAKRLKTGTLRKLDVDAPSKLTLDHLMAALGVDDAHVRALEVTQTILEADTPRVGGYGKTRQGAWVSVWRLTPAEHRRLDAEQPGAPG